MADVEKPASEAKALEKMADVEKPASETKRAAKGARSLRRSVQLRGPRSLQRSLQLRLQGRGLQR